MTFQTDEDTKYPQTIGYTELTAAATPKNFKVMNTSDMSQIESVSPDNGPEFAAEFDEMLKAQNPPIRRVEAEPYKAQVHGRGKRMHQVAEQGQRAQSVASGLPYGF